MASMRQLALYAVIASSPLAASPPAAAPGDPATAPAIVSAAEGEGAVVVYATTDSTAVAAMLKDFAALYPKIKVEYDDMNSTEVYNRFVSEAAAGAGSADVLWSSAMDLQIKLAKDAYTQAYESPEASKLPSWAVWRHEAWGTTYEPIVFVYNKRLLKPEEVPQSHAELAKALTTLPDRFKGKVTSYDPERSGIGFLLITQDSIQDKAFADTAHAYGAVGVKLYTSTGAMMERIQSGEHLIGFNMIASYAVQKQKKDPSLGLVFPKDYTLIMSRIALLPKAAKHPNAAKVFLDYVLSARGQKALSTGGSVFALRPEVEGELGAAGVNKTLGQAARPIPVGEALLEYLDQGKRLQFLRQWQQAALGK
jgi:iron(III) transport system substrate-binding protein